MSSTSRAVLGWISTIGVFVAVLSYILVTATAPTLIAATQLGNDLSSFSGQPPLGAFFIYARLPVIAVSINLLAVTYFCILVFGACFVAAFRSRGGFLLSLKRLTKVGRITSSSNWLVAMPLVSSALLIVVVLVTELLSVAGVPSGTLCNPKINPCPTPAQLFAGLAYAPIGEELAFRIITPLGLVIPLRVLWRRLVTRQGPSKSKFLSLVGLSLLSPERAKAKTGYPTFTLNGWRGVHWLEWIFIAVSSISFGLAHVEPGGGTNWGQGKVVTAGISGIALAIVFVAYGAYAAVLLHWFFDFYFEVLALGFPVSGSGSLFALLVNVISLGGLLVIGTLSITVGIIWFAKRIRDRVGPTAYKIPEPGTLPVQA